MSKNTVLYEDMIKVVTPQDFPEMRPVGNLADKPRSRAIRIVLTILLAVVGIALVVMALNAMPSASEVIGNEMNRVIADCDSGSSPKDCEYLAEIERRKRK